MAVSEVMKSMKKLKSNELTEFGNKLGKNLGEGKTSDVLRSVVDGMTQKAKTKMVAETAARLSEKERKTVAKTLGLEPPNGKTRDRLWIIAVVSFAIVMVGAFLFIAFGIFMDKPANPIASGDLLLSIFTAAVGFFAGLFAPGPGG